jgi:hypothetical protein
MLGGLSKSDLDRFLQEEEAEQAIGHIANNLFAGHPNLVEGIRQLELYSLCRLLRPEVVIETGVQNGISSLLILSALKKNERGWLHSVDLPNVGEAPLAPGKEPGWLVPHNMRNKWQIYIGDSRDVLPRLLDSAGRVDIFLHDSEHSYEVMSREFRMVWPFIRESGVLLSDDTGRNSAFIDFCASVGAVPCWTYRGHGIIRKSRRGVVLGSTAHEDALDQSRTADCAAVTPTYVPLSSLRAAACTFLSRTMGLTTYLANSIVDLTKGAIRSKIKQRGRDAAPRQRATRW